MADALDCDRMAMESVNDIKDLGTEIGDTQLRHSLPSYWQSKILTPSFFGKEGHL